MKLFVYDHCPYCVKARMIFGLKNIKFELVTLLNDDEETPISMIGQKMLPILEKDDGSFMAESLDIIDYVDANYGGKRVISDDISTGLTNWLSQTHSYLYHLCMPRWARADLEEFKTQSAIDYFTVKKESYIGSFAANLAKSEQLIDKANEHLQELDKILQNYNYQDRISLSDVDLFATLRSLSIVKALIYPKNVKEYRQNISLRSKISLHDDLAN